MDGATTGSPYFAQPFPFSHGPTPSQTAAGHGAAPSDAGPTFSNGWRLTYEMIDECDMRYATTSVQGEEERAKLKRAIARGYLEEIGMTTITEKDVELLADSFPLPPDPPLESPFDGT